MKKNGTTTETREGWLLRASAILTAEVLPKDAAKPALPVQVSTGFPKGRHGRGRAIGQCWAPGAARDGRSHIFISPELDEPDQILATLLHELIHASVGVKGGHRGAFAKLARTVGLEKPFTRSVPGVELSGRLNAVSVRLGTFPHGALTYVDRPRAGSRLRLWECECGIKVRVASDDFDATCNECDGVFEVQQ